MRPRFQRKFFATSLLIFLLPVVAFLTVSVRMIVQERELATKRRSDDLERTVRRIRDELYAKLEGIRTAEVSRELSGDDGISPLVDQTARLVGRIKDGRLVVPWEKSSSPPPSTVGFAELFHKAEHLELATKNAVGACDVYSKAIKVASVSEAARARLGLTRTCKDPDYKHLRAALAEDPTSVDEMGVPWRLYAAARAAKITTLRQDLERSLDETVRAEVELTPTAAYMMRDIAATLGRPALEDEIGSRVDRIAHGLELQARFESLYPPETRTSSGRQTWIATSQGWLDSVTPHGRDAGILVAVKSDPVFDQIQDVRSGARIHLTKLSIGGERLGPEFPGIGIVIEEPEGASEAGLGEPREWVLIGGMAIVVLLTGSTGWLAYRDVRREVTSAEERSQFVSSITHELRTPLTSIRMFAEMLQMRRGQNEQRDLHYLDTIVHESERLTRLVNDVLLFARIERGEMTYRFGLACLKEIVLEATGAMEYQLAGQGFNLHLEMDDGDAKVLADRDTLIQAILNLLTNAVKYSGDSREIRLRLRRRNASAVIEVVDYGIGITKEAQEHIFDKFFRASGPEVQNVPGAGIGLSIVWKIVRAHQGEVRVESQPGRGSTFSILIPVEQTA